MHSIYLFTAAVAFVVLLFTAGLVPAIAGAGCVALSASLTEFGSWLGHEDS